MMFFSLEGNIVNESGIGERENLANAYKYGDLIYGSGNNRGEYSIMK